MTPQTFGAKITVAEAIKVGRRKILWPIKGFFIGFGLLNFFAVGYALYDVSRFLPAMFAISVLIVLATWAWWAYHIVEWRFWAVANVQDLDKLEIRARENQLIHNKLDQLGRFEIAGAETRERYKQWYRKYRAGSKEESAVDRSLPAETILAYSWRSQIRFLSAGVIGLVIIGGHQLGFRGYFELGYPLGVIMLGVFLFLMIRFLIKKSRSPQVLKINDQWIQFKQDPPIPWKAIHSALCSAGEGKNPQTYLTIQTNVGPKLVWNVTDLNFSVEQLEHIVDVYRARAKKNA